MEDRANPFSRRRVLKLGGLSLVLLGTRPLQALAATPGDRRVLVVVFQRGGADGLHMVIPYRDGRYRSLRGALALPEPGRGDDRPLDIGDGFALHPALAPLHPHFEAGRLAVVHAVGSPDPTRSHFDAQDYMESGTPGDKGTSGGWLTRVVTALTDRDASRAGPFLAVALTSTLPRSLSGTSHALAMQDFSRLTAGPADLESRLERLYRQSPESAFSTAGEEAFEALARFRRADPLAIPSRVHYPRGRLSRSFRQLGALLKADLGIRVAFVESSGWDTHFNQGGATGSMARSLQELAGNLDALLADLGDQVPITVLTMTEFGRTASVNGSGGTDHGHGTAMMVLGRGVRGGRTVGDWPGLSRQSLYQGRDLAATTDFRDLFGEVARETLELSGDATLFPDYRSSGSPGVMSRS